MTTTKIRFLAFPVLTLILFSFSSFAYPVWIKIENPRAHALYLVSESEGVTVEIPPGGFREFKVAGANDWRVRYSSGIYHAAKVFNLDKDINHFIDNSCRNCMGDNWNKKTVKYCTLRLDETESGIATSSYTLTVIEIRDLNMAYESDACKLNPNEMAMKLVAISRGYPLVASDLFAQAHCLFRGSK